MTKPLILGSLSPRRREILNFFSLPFIQVASHFDEASISFLGDPARYALTLAEKKSEVLAQQFPESIILSADTIVYAKDKIYNKPVDKAHAHAMLNELSGSQHSVFTAVAVRQMDSMVSDCEETKVYFRSLSDEQIALYHNHCQFLDKAGGYAIQNAGSMIVEKIDGCYYNVMGLPLGLTRALLLNFGIDLWDYLNPF
jgi:septum formation protein